MRLFIIDSREHAKAIKGIKKYFDDHGINYFVSKLLFGDYMDYNHPGVVIDRKQNIGELSKNCTTEHVRFRAEFERAKTAGAKLIVLVEQNRFRDRGEDVRVETVDDLMRWSATHKTRDGREVTIRGEKIYRVLVSWMAKYPLEVRFCDKRSTGRVITEILTGSAEEIDGRR